MACFNPIFIPIPDNPYSEKRMAVPCGKCIACLNKRRNDWVIRLMEERKDSLQAYFLTLTYNEDFVPIKILPSGYYTYTLNKEDLQKFWKRVRKDKRNKNNKIKYYAVGEYGEHTQRPHYHAIVFNADSESLHESWRVKGKPIGKTQCDEVTEASVRYVTKYMINSKDDAYANLERPFATMSKNLGMGYIKRTAKFHKQRKKLFTTREGGIKLGLPRYYKEKLFTEEELKELHEQAREESTLNMEREGYERLMAQRKTTTVRTKQKSKSKKL